MDVAHILLRLRVRLTLIPLLQGHKARQLQEARTCEIPNQVLTNVAASFPAAGDHPYGYEYFQPLKISSMERI